LCIVEGLGVVELLGLAATAYAGVVAVSPQGHAAITQGLENITDNLAEMAKQKPTTEENVEQWTRRVGNTNADSSNFLPGPVAKYCLQSAGNFKNCGIVVAGVIYITYKVIRCGSIDCQESNTSTATPPTSTSTPTGTPNMRCVPYTYDSCTPYSTSTSTPTFPSTSTPTLPSTYTPSPLSTPPQNQPLAHIE
jgi:hypothetical protein